MEVIIDRFEGEYAVVEIEIDNFVLIPKVLLPNAKEGDIVSITIEKNKTKKRREHINNLVNHLFED